MTRAAPKRWLDDGGSLGSRPSATSSARASTSSSLRRAKGRRLGRDHGWSSPPPGGGSSGAGGKAVAAKGVGGAAKAASLAAGGVLKGMLLGAGGAALLVGGYVAIAAVRGPAAKPAPSAVATSVDERPAFDSVPFPALTVAVSAQGREAAREPAADLSRIAGARAPSTGSAPPIAAPDPAERQTQMKEVSNALSEARASLRGGNPGGALAQLEAMRSRFPPELLGPEREVLTIEALSNAGHGDQARARAEAFPARAPPTRSTRSASNRSPADREKNG